MARLSNIPERFHQNIADMLADGKSASHILVFLEGQGIKTSLTAIHMLSRKIRMQRQEAAKAAYAEAVEKTAAHDLLTMEKVISSLEKKYLAAIEKDDHKLYLSIASELNKWNQRRIELSGITKETHSTNDEDLEDSKDEFISNLLKVNEQRRDSN